MKTLSDMKQIQQNSSAENYSAVNLGSLSEIKDYVLEFSPEIKIPGKVFGGQAVGATGSEFSFQVFAPGQETGFLHIHKTHEELYFFLSGKGEFQVDKLERYVSGKIGYGNCEKLFKQRRACYIRQTCFCLFGYC